MKVIDLLQSLADSADIPVEEMVACHMCKIQSFADWHGTATIKHGEGTDEIPIRTYYRAQARDWLREMNETD